MNKSIGGLYEKVAKTGSRFLSGFIEIEGKRHSIVCFQNFQKKTDKTPDWSILPSEPRPTAEAPRAALPPTQEINPDDIPF